MNKRILIISSSDDLHVDILIPRLEAKAARPFRLNLDTFPRDFELVQHFNQHQCSGAISHIPSGDTLDLDDIGAIWVRKNAEFNFLSDDLGVQEEAYAREETKHTLFGLLYSLDCYWMSHPLAMRGAQYKSEQMQRAIKAGFQIPTSIISNQPAAVKDFKHSLEGDMIFKAMSTAGLAADKVDEADRQSHGLPTTIISDDDMADIDAVAEVPCYFQAYIDKQYELRVTVVGEQVFAAKIDSQLDQRTKTDFRDFSVDIPYSAVKLPAEIEQRCREFVHSYDLNYGALDLIVTPDNQYVFLENNPGGQFWFIEQLVPELNIMDTVAQNLIDGAKC
ncbi:MAG: glutathione synthase/RimK-type ligase-like ATP-grasp enzyme [Phenylobacterium sp.]|jgi:glutathione synthase/RimK-type ligase-like ATP-grasp enzyme